MAITPEVGYSESGEVNPAANAVAVTPADVDLDKRTRAVYVGVAGDLNVIMSGGQTVTFVGVLGGSVLPIRVDQIKAATTAASIIALF